MFEQVHKLYTIHKVQNVNIQHDKQYQLIASMRFVQNFDRFPQWLHFQVDLDFLKFIFRNLNRQNKLSFTDTR